MKQWQKFKALLSEHKLLSGLVTGVIVVILTLVFIPPISANNTTQVAEAENITNVIGEDSVQIHQEITNHYNFTPEQIDKNLKKQINQVLSGYEPIEKELYTIETELYNQAVKDELLITQLKEKSAENYRLNNEFKALNEKLQDITTTYQQEVQLREEVEKALLTLKSNQPKAKIAQVLKELRNNPDTRKVEKDLNEIVESGTKELAPVAYESGRLAENRVDYCKAMKAFTKAVTLNKNNPSYLLKAAQMAEKVGNFNQAQQWFETLIKLTQHDINSLDYAAAQDGLANIFFYEQRKYNEAEPLYRRSLAITEKVMGENHPSLATTLNNLANLYRTQGKYAKAESLYKRSLAIKEKALGENHPSVATILNNLAELYRTQSKYTKAELLYKRALAITEKALGENALDVAATLSNFAGLYEAQGKYAKAESFHKRYLAIIEKELGKNHPYVATTLNRLAVIYDEQGEYIKAETSYKRALNILHKTFPKGHSDIDIIESNYEMLKNKK
ncbi:tetratricopeptide repeat protein [Pasteurella atlantica]|uniref:Tetratricopeptide repeat protein n=2 Tax=Pasteurellaceae TaxID=712 RepID=A0ACC6HLG9_9PAST|nr:tetratricopeptide repeat protein [Pasteurella atlantica]MDP8051720.1 tetratricopeptide repeat protein [Pasteurella atlantica]MDP8104957.1 tetratricopeptide repeat protein [Pasteurella atlantica]MDP8148378.1 tetratricopeptide repeat protein [Pasteurella atlantica]